MTKNFPQKLVDIYMQWLACNKFNIYDSTYSKQKLNICMLYNWRLNREKISTYNRVFFRNWKESATY